MTIGEWFGAFAPATVANLASGFDILGLALPNFGDVVYVRLLPTLGGNVRLLKIWGENADLLPLDPNKNTATVSIKALAESISLKNDIEVILEKRMPLGSGLGSSASSAVASIVALNAALGNLLPKKDLLVFAMEGERIACGSAHADNAAPSLLGGITLISNLKGQAKTNIHQLPIPEELRFVVVHPKVELQTSASRALLRKTVLMESLVGQTSAIANLVAGLYESNPEMISNGLQDFVAEPVRGVLIPNYYSVKQTALAHGALGACISGSGPSIFAATWGNKGMERVGGAMQTSFKNVGIKSNIISGAVNKVGAEMISISAELHKELNQF